METAVKTSVSLYPVHIAAIDGYAEELELPGAQTRSTALQRMIRDWQRQREELLALREEVQQLRSMTKLSLGAPVFVPQGALEPVPARGPKPSPEPPVPPAPPMRTASDQEA